MDKIKDIVMMINPEVNQYMSNGSLADVHDGCVFSNMPDAQEYAKDAVKNNLCTRFVIGNFMQKDNDDRRANIQNVETFGFRHDKKNIKQLQFFK